MSQATARSARIGPYALSTLITASLVILACAPAQYLGRQQDDLLYLIGAQSLLEGKFRLLTVPGEPPLYMVSPAFPALLAPLALLAGENWWVYQVFSAALLAAAPWLIWFWLRRRLDDARAVLIAAVFATSPVVLSQSGTVMSDAPFLLATIGLLLALEKPSRNAAAGLLLFATQLRTAAVVLLPAAAARALSRRRWKEAATLCAPALGGIVLWSLWSRAAAGTAQQKVEELFVSYADGLGRLPGVALENALYYLDSWGAGLLPAAWSAAGRVVGAALLACALRGAWLLWRRDKWEPALWTLGGTIALHLCWPWHYERYLIMPLPFLLWCAAEGLGRAAKPALAAAACAQLFFWTPRLIDAPAAWTKPELARTYEWIRTRTPPSAAMASVMYIRDGFLCARPAIPMPPGGDAKSLRDTLLSRKVRWVLWQDGLDLGLSLDASSTVRGQLDSDAQGLRDRKFFRLSHEEKEEHARVYEVL